MARLDKDSISKKFAPHLQEGELLEHFAYGIKQPHVVAIALLMFLAILPGILIVALLTKSYLVGKTNKRIVVLKIDGRGRVRRVTPYGLDEFRGAAVSTSTGKRLTHVRIDIPAKPFVAKFHPAFAPFNRPGAMAIAAAIDPRAEKTAAPAMALLDAILLLGPTGAGKSPLGERIEQRGLWGRRCFHFDFGENLRAVAALESAPGFSAAQLDYVRDVLERGALLENETFVIAENILDRFIASRGVGPGDLLVMNGLPRHVGQARDVGGRVRMIRVVELVCDAGTVVRRISTNAGSDRAGRKDDAIALVRQKLRTFAARTAPLLAHYEQQGVLTTRVRVSAATQPDELIAELTPAPPANP